MQDFDFEVMGPYTGIYMRWCIGYLQREEQVEFLKGAKTSLLNGSPPYSRKNAPPSYIFIMDNIDDDTKRKKPLRIKG